MKSIYKILGIVSLFIIGISCENDGGDSKLNLKNGAVIDVQKKESTDAFINLVKIQEGSDIELGLTINNALGEITSLNVLGLFIKNDGKIYKGIFATGIKTLPFSITINKNQLFAAFAEINSSADIEIGDKLVLFGEITLKDGTKIKLLNDDGSNNTSPGITNSSTYSLSQTYNVSCLSDLGGTYSVISSGESTDPGPTTSENPISNYPYTITLLDNGGGNYTISDAFGGLYILWYDIYGISEDTKGTFSDVCGKISGAFDEPFDSKVTYTGSVSSTGIISIEWENGYGDNGKMTLTKTK